MSNRAVNLGLLGLVLAGTATGLGAFLTGSISGRWIFWAHSIAGFAIVLLLIWKRRIILRSIQRHGGGVWAIPSLFLLVLLLSSLGSGIAWSTMGLPALAGESGLTLHAAVSLVVAILLIPHAHSGWPGLAVARRPGRRGFLCATAFLGAGALLWRGTELLSAGARQGGAARRFTGSRAAASFSANDFPSNSWLLDDPHPIDPSAWRLSVAGAVRAPLLLALDELDTVETTTATIDCTGGWYSTQDWTGVPLQKLLSRAMMAPGARSVVIRSSTGYWRRLSTGQSASALLAQQVGSELLAHEHGAPLRLVVPGSRGYDWVKWVTSVEASRLPSWWRWPLPIS